MTRSTILDNVSLHTAPIPQRICFSISLTKHFAWFIIMLRGVSGVLDGSRGIMILP